MKATCETIPHECQVDLISDYHHAEDGINDTQVPGILTFWTWPDHAARKRLVLKNDVLKIVFSATIPSPAGVCECRMSAGILRTRTRGFGWVRLLKNFLLAAADALSQEFGFLFHLVRVTGRR
jgi:hypothetical protein